MSAAAELAGPAATAWLAGQLTRWLPAQRWYPGTSPPSRLEVVSDVLLSDGFPVLRHLIVAAALAAGPARFQVPVGYRPDGPGMPGVPAGALIGRRDGVACYDALHDPQLAGLLLAGIAQQRAAGPLRFAREPGAPDLAGLPGGRVLAAEQSNTSVVFGDRVILKMLRRLFPGANPDLEVAGALARLGSRRVAAPYGRIETAAAGEPVLLGVASRFLAGAADGWTLALDSARGQAPFGAQARQLGAATAELHADLARAFGSRELSAGELAGLAAAMRGRLAAAAAEVAALRPHEPRAAAAFGAVAQLAGPVAVQRIHGDYHLGQVLRAAGAWVALDFEGEPGVPLAARREMGPALRDVAGMLRSFDYAARHDQAARNAGHAGPAGQAGRAGPDAAGEAGASAWARQCQDAFCAGYAAAGGGDPRSDGALLRALMLDKAVYEVVYEYRHRPGWLAIPLGFVAAA